MHTITRILATIALAATLLVGAPVVANADTPSPVGPNQGDDTATACEFALLEAQATIHDLHRELARQDERHADELDDLNDVLLYADQRATEQTNRHAEELAGVFAQLDDAQAETRKAEAEVLEERDERVDAERMVARRDARIARLVAKVAALKAAR